MTFNLDYTLKELRQIEPEYFTPTENAESEVEVTHHAPVKGIKGQVYQPPTGRKYCVRQDGLEIPPEQGSYVIGRTMMEILVTFVVPTIAAAASNFQ